MKKNNRIRNQRSVSFHDFKLYLANEDTKDFLKSGFFNNLFMTNETGSDDLNWLLKELATSNLEVSHNIASESRNDWAHGENQECKEGECENEQINDEDSYTDLENEILKQMNLSTT